MHQEADNAAGGGMLATHMHLLPACCEVLQVQSVLSRVLHASAHRTVVKRKQRSSRVARLDPGATASSGAACERGERQANKATSSCMP
jgi:hypothetical protein